MGTGWEYFNNVCQALRVAIGVTASIVGVVAAFLIYGAVAAHLQPPSPDTAPASMYQQGSAAQDAAPSAEQKSAYANAAARARATNTGTAYVAPAAASAAAPAARNANAGPRASSYHPGMQPNPQFGGGGNMQPNPQFGGSGK